MLWKDSEWALTCRVGNLLVQSDTGLLVGLDFSGGEYKGDWRPQGVSHFN